MKALTLWRPWPWAIFHAPPGKRKDIENRNWAAPWIVGKTVAIHAGKSVDDDDAFDFIEDICGERPPLDCPMGIIGVVRFDAMLRESPSEWFVGEVGWHIEKARALREPILCKGAQGLWSVSPDAERLIRAQLAEGRA